MANDEKKQEYFERTKDILLREDIDVDLAGILSESKSERTADLKAMRELARRFYAELEAPTNPSEKNANENGSFTRRVNKKDLKVKVDTLETLLSKQILTVVNADPDMVACNEISRMLKGLSDKFHKIFEQWETNLNFVAAINEAADRPVIRTRTRYEIHQDYIALRFVYQNILGIVTMLHSEEKDDYAELPAKSGNYDDGDSVVREIPAIYSWAFYIGGPDDDYSDASPLWVTLKDTPFFQIALTFGWITPNTQSFDFADFQKKCNEMLSSDDAWRIDPTGKGDE